MLHIAGGVFLGLWLFWLVFFSLPVALREWCEAWNNRQSRRAAEYYDYHKGREAARLDRIRRREVERYNQRREAERRPVTPAPKPTVYGFSRSTKDGVRTS